MSFTKMEKNVLNISALPDKVQNQAQTLKATFDQAGVDIKDALNGLINELESKESAGNLGAIKNGAIITLQAYLDSLNDGKQDSVEGKGLSTEDFTTLLKERLESMEDGANNYTLSEATDETLGGIILGTTLAWVNGKVESLSAPSPDTLARQAITNHTNDTVAHVTEEEKQGWDGKANLYRHTTTIPTSGWSTSAPFTLDISIEGITENDYPDISVIHSETKETAEAQLEAWNCISKIETGENKITCTCYESVPTTEIPILIKGVR